MHEHFRLICMHLPTLYWTSEPTAHLPPNPTPQLNYGFIESACPSCLDPIILLSVRSLTSLYYKGKPMELQYHLSQPTTRSICPEWQTAITHRIFDPSYRGYIYANPARDGCWPFICQLKCIHIHTHTAEIQRERGGAGATSADLWVIMGHEYVCRHNEIYKLLQILRLGFYSLCLMPRHVPSGAR